MHPTKRPLSRRQFVAAAGSLAAAGMVNAADVVVSIVLDPKDPLYSPPVQWATQELQQSLAARGIQASTYSSIAQVKSGGLVILIADARSKVASPILKRAQTTIAPVSEALGLIPGESGKHPVTLACGHDSRGLVYAVLDLVDRVQNANDPWAALHIDRPITERPANPVRSVMRMFTSDVEDKPWYNDRQMWPHYLTMLASQRFNRFNLAFGIGYDFIRQVTDAYFLFTYPFLLSVPGYNVRAPQLPDSERDNNLQMLQFISEQTVARGMEFQLGLWMHGYEWIDSPHPNYTIEGLSSANHGPYCRDAVRLLLQKCPAISGVTFRIHGESGVQEGSYPFWKSVFEGVATCGRPIRLDTHSKGLDKQMQDLALATGLAVTVSPKFWAEHMGMPYHQADIRELEQPKPGKKTSALMNLSDGSRSFMRYGYGDLLKDDRSWKVIHRIWPGTQRLLLWGDPLTASAYSKAFTFCGSSGVDICEPLSFKGRRGSGIAGDRCAYADKSLKPRWDWQKYIYGYRIWGRMLYNPDSSPEGWRRYLDHEYKAAAAPVESALANASRILPTVTTAHGASAANNSYWPEVYFNQSMVDADHFQPYSDSPAPRVFGNVSPFDPQLFARINDFADSLLDDHPSGKYSPIEVAQWIEDYADAANMALTDANTKAVDKVRPEYRRLAIDVEIQIGLGRFFGAKLRSGVLYRIYQQTNHPAALSECISQYRKARAAWSQLANRAAGVYMSDITIGEHPQLRGHWLDRLPAIDKDIAALDAIAAAPHSIGSQPANEAKVQRAIAAALSRPVRSNLNAAHNPPSSFRPGQVLTLDLSLKEPAESVRLYYRHVNQAERYQSIAMQASGNLYRAAVPTEYTASEYPVEYYFEINRSGSSQLYPGFSTSRPRQPYFVVRQANHQSSDTPSTST
jgi:hypothetical protein